MRWMKHPGGFCHSPAMSELRDALGFAGYGAFWVMLERIAEAWNGQGDPELCLSEKEWQISCGFTPKQFRIFLEILQKNAVIHAAKRKSLLCLNASILLLLQDEWTRKARKNSGAAPASLRSFSGIQTDTEKEIEKDKRQNTQFPPGLRSSLFPVLKRHGIEIHSERGRNIIRHIEGKAPRNPGGYLESILQRKPGFDPSDGEATNRQTDSRQGPQAVGDMLRRAGYGPRGEEQ